MAPKAAQEKAKKKAKRQKKILMVLAVPMVGALVYGYMTFSSLGGKKQVAAPVTAAPATGTATGATPTSAASPDSPVTPGIAAVQITALHSFTALGRKDPFHDHGPNLGAAASSSSSSSSKGKGSDCPQGGLVVKGHLQCGKVPTTPPAPLTGAVISINGNKLALALGTEFGHAPGLTGVWLFRLVKATAKTALIGVVGTKQQFTLHVSEPLTLQQNGGWTYTLILQPVGSATPMTVQQTTTTP